jgi:ABC-type Fe3+-hydroxamate transport system substrate-binding protein
MTELTSAASIDRTDAVGVSHAPAGADARIVCLVPSITELLFDLGLGDQIVGRTGFCFYPKNAVKRVPKVGGTKDFDLDRIRSLRPTHLVVNIDENPRERVEAVGQSGVEIIVTHPMGPLDNPALYRLLGAIFNREREAQKLQQRFAAAYADAVAATRDLPRERVLYVIWKKPWMSISPDTYIARTLAAVGWQHIELGSEARYPEVEPESLVGRVDRVLLSSEPYAFRPRDVAEIEAMDRAGHGLKASLIDAEMTSWYGSRAIAGMAYLAKFRKQTLGL